MLQAKPKVEAITLTLFVVVVAANPVNKDTEGTTESVPINEECLLSGYVIIVKKPLFTRKKIPKTYKRT